jgi:cyclin G-associated kinase
MVSAPTWLIFPSLPFVSAHTVNEPATATNDNMNSSNAVHHPPPRPPPARPHSAPDSQPETPGRPSRPPPLSPKPSPLHQSPPQSQQPPSYHQTRSQQGVPAVPQASGGLFSSLRGGAGNFLKNLKDTTGKVMQTVQQWVLNGRNAAVMFV